MWFPRARPVVRLYRFVCTYLGVSRGGSRDEHAMRGSSHVLARTTFQRLYTPRALGTKQNTFAMRANSA